jgi:hypothetical protein
MVGVCVGMWPTTLLEGVRAAGKKKIIVSERFSAQCSVSRRVTEALINLSWYPVLK